ncbi:hypothetical protein PoB_001340100 [Plakobranchus ocellatus]|uniref:Tudor domain-containing protein n=1 Tax=Plakobranchus ocellatus TaxID=259542 RepID=A0AAV3YTY1_9GAST|nr:hypothetical protein PoB_001340100 [Plakobranchus ocellatus]
MWSTTRSDMVEENWVSNHFVPLMPLVRPKPVQVSNHSTLEVELPKLDSFYLVDWHGQDYLAQVLDVDPNEGTFLVKFMAQRKICIIGP